MSNITKNDLKAFSKVLSAIDEQISENPDALLELINSLSKKDFKKFDLDFETIASKVDEFDLFKKAENGQQHEIEMFLSEFSPKELAFINKHLSFPYNRSKSKNTLIRDIIDQLEKRTTSVFRNHE